MDNQDKIFEKIKNAAHKAEEKDFPGMDRIWQKVEAQLEQKELQTKNKTWKKIAIAASIVLLISLGYQFLKPTEISSKNKMIVGKEQPSKRDNETAIINTQIDTDKIITVINETKTAVVTKDVQTQIAEPSALAMQENPNNVVEKTEDVAMMRSERETILKNKTTAFRTRIFDAIVVKSTCAKKEQTDTVAPKKGAVSSALLVVMNDKLMKSKYKSIQEAKDKLPKELKEDEIESLIILNEPLYIINGVEYTEESLFGTHPTSPYAPLDKQNITIIEVLQNEDAIEIYGEKGSKGIVIITTKNKIPSGK